MTDAFKEKSKYFFPREIYFWILNTLGWVIILRAINHKLIFLTYLNDDQLKFMWTYLIFIWLAYYVVGTFSVLLFRFCYYRQRWYEKKFIGSLPLVLLVAIGGGFAIAFLVDLPVNAMLGFPFRLVSESGEVTTSIFFVTLYGAIQLSMILMLWLLVYLGIEGTLNARNLAIRALALENSLKDARLNALSGQINPHFLFNALNNIRFMIQRDAERAEDSLVALAEILRHSLETSSKEKVPLSRELAIVERYLSLMKNQMKDRLDYSIQAADVSDNNLIPPMIIQMLAENAIKHGVEQIKEGGRVSIHCSNRGDRLLIEVRNSALSTHSDIDNVVTPAAEGKDYETGNEKGVGLANISNRLSLLYGDRAQLSMFSQGSDFKVVIELPGEEAE